MKIVINKEELRTVIENALFNGLAWVQGYGLSVTIQREQYDTALAVIEAEGKLDTICYEDVLMQHLISGEALEFYDAEGEETVGFTLEQAKVNLASEEGAEYVMDMLNENDDAITADSILQIAIYGEIIFG